MQQQAARAGIPITNEKLVKIATKEMLSAQRFPTKNDKLEELGRSAQTLSKWKELYKISEKQSIVKRQAAGGQDQFGGAVMYARKGGVETPGGRGTPVTIDELEGCFDSLATAETKGKTTLDELVKTNSTLYSSIAEFVATKTRLTKDVASLSQEVNKYKKWVNTLMTEEESRPSI